MTAIDYTKLNKIQKIAAFLIIIGPDAAAEVMKQFETSQLELICREMAHLDFIDQTTQRKLLAEFGTLVASGVNSILGGVSYAQAALGKAKGDYTASSILKRFAPTTPTFEAGEDIRQMEGRQVLNLIKSEQPQTIAFVLSYMDVSKAAEIVTMLAPELREEVVERLGEMEATSRDVVGKIARNLNSRFDKNSLQQVVHRSGGVKTVASLLNALDKETRKTLLTRMEERNAQLGALIRKEVFSFDDLVQLEPGDMQRVMREVDMSDLAIALKASKPALVEAVLKAVSKRAAESLKEEIQMMASKKPKEVEFAQDKIIQIVRRLEEAEEITFDGGSTDNV